MNFIRIAAATPQIEVANCAHNTERVLEIMEKASAQQVQLLCLPELCITGATCGDLFLQPTLIQNAKTALDKLVSASKNFDMIVAVGLPYMHEGKLYNAAAVFSQGKLLGIVAKKNAEKPFVRADLGRPETIVPTGSHNNTDNCSDGSPGLSTARVTPVQNSLFVCESFTFAVEIGTDLLLPIPPSTRHAMAGANIILNLAATCEFVGKPEFRRRTVTGQSSRLGCGYVYANAGFGESTTDEIYGGHNLIVENGTILQESEPFGEGWAVADLDLQMCRSRTFENRISGSECNEHFPSHSYEQTKLKINPLTNIMREIDPLPFAKNPKQALQIQTAGLAKRLKHTGSNAVIGVSGGLDSCLALLVTARAYEFLGRPLSDIIAVTMPCFGTTRHTKNNAHSLCQSLGIPCREIDITASVTRHLEDIDHPSGVFDITFENAQARMRTMVLMNIANQANGIVIGTGSLSELALGWATYNGDHMSMYAVNAGVPKTLVRRIVEYIAENPVALCHPASDGAVQSVNFTSGLGLSSTGAHSLSTVLHSILATKVTPELLPTQNGDITQITEDVIGPYEVHDFFIYHVLHVKRAPQDILAVACIAFKNKYTPEQLKHWQQIFNRRFFSQQFKRNCLPDAPQVVQISLSPRSGLKMPSDASPHSWE